MKILTSKISFLHDIRTEWDKEQGTCTLSTWEGEQLCVLSPFPKEGNLMHYDKFFGCIDFKHNHLTAYTYQGKLVFDDDYDPNQKVNNLLEKLDELV